MDELFNGEISTSLKEAYSKIKDKKENFLNSDLIQQLSSIITFGNPTKMMRHFHLRLIKIGP